MCEIAVFAAWLVFGGIRTFIYGDGRPKSEARFAFGKSCSCCGERLMNAARVCPKCGQEV